PEGSSDLPFAPYAVGAAAGGVGRGRGSRTGGLDHASGSSGDAAGGVVARFWNADDESDQVAQDGRHGALYGAYDGGRPYLGFSGCLADLHQPRPTAKRVGRATGCDTANQSPLWPVAASARPAGRRRLAHLL